MKQPDPVPVDALERVFHEPNRLAIVSALCAADDPISFTLLRDQCRLTDGNLNRHLKSLEDEGIIRVKKAFVDRKPRTTVALTSQGLDRFQQYVNALETALSLARESMPPDRRPGWAATGKKARA